MAVLNKFEMTFPFVKQMHYLKAVTSVPNECGLELYFIKIANIRAL